MKKLITVTTVVVISGCVQPPMHLSGGFEDGSGSLTGTLGLGSNGIMRPISAVLEQKGKRTDCTGYTLAKKGVKKNGHIMCPGIGGGIVSVTANSEMGYGSGKIGSKPIAFSLTAEKSDDAN